jgi:hypothetical protein
MEVPPQLVKTPLDILLFDRLKTRLQDATIDVLLETRSLLPDARGSVLLLVKLILENRRVL